MLDAETTKQSQGRISEVFGTFLKLGFTSFGGPVAHIGYFRKELVERQAWLSENQFSQLLAICQFLPGPASSQLGFALGLLRAGWLGAIAAFLAFTLPSAIVLVCFAALLPLLSGDMYQAGIHGLKLVACVVVADAVFGMAKKLCPDIVRRALAIAAAGALLMATSAWAQIGVVILGALAGIFLCRETINTKQPLIHVSYGKRLASLLFLLFLLLLTGFILLPNSGGLLGLAQVFYQAGALVFGGGHVVLPLLEESIVAAGLLGADSFLAGYGASQAIPGPMFAFAAYLGALIPSGITAWLGACIALVFMFLPGFLLIAAALPLWQHISGQPKALNAIAGVNAAVVGILAAALYDPIITAGITSVIDVIITCIGFVILFRWKLSPLVIVGWCVLASIISSLVF